jgi:hypothetical protein
MMLHLSRKDVLTGVAMLAWLGAACFNPRSVSSGQTQTAGQTQSAAVGVIAAWERRVDGSYENRGIAQIEKSGDRWALTILCDGTHTTYLDDTTIDLNPHVGGFVQARYHYVDRVVEARCIQAPCGPVSQRFIALERLTKVSTTAEKARAQRDRCEDTK